MNARQREAVPLDPDPPRPRRHDPPPKAPAGLTEKLKRALRLLALFALVVAVIAALLVARGQAGFHIHMLIATFVGMGLAVFIGGALMLLIFYSAASGHDDRAARFDPENDE
jgi:hypothetical protein